MHKPLQQNPGSSRIQAFVMANEKLCLKWNDFQNIVQTSFGELSGDNDFTDVTLACEDKIIKAHKVILSACSPFFKRLLKSHQHPQPLIYMRGVKSSVLTAIVDFIYLGEANVFQGHLEGFLALAEEFELKGLNGTSANEEASEQPKESFSRNERRTAWDQQQNESGSLMSTTVKHDGQKIEGTVMRIQSTPRRQTSIIDADTIKKIDLMIEKRIDGYFCTNCGSTTKHLGHMRQHVEKHIEGLQYPCNDCDKVFRSSNVFRVHRNRCQSKLKN